MNDGFSISKLAIFGVGLIGGSLAMGLKKAGVVDHVVGVGRSPENLHKALELGVIDEIQTDALMAVRDADVVVLATPVDTVIHLLRMIEPVLQPPTIVTNVGSVKAEISHEAEQILGNNACRFVPDMSYWLNLT